MSNSYYNNTILASLIAATFLFTLAITSTACQSDEENAQDEIDSITYMQDQTTGICFAITIEWGEYDSGRGLATVPCEQVKHRISDYVIGPAPKAALPERQEAVVSPSGR